MILSPRLSDCPACDNIFGLIDRIDQELSSLGCLFNTQIRFGFQKNFDFDRFQLLGRMRRILQALTFNPGYIHPFSPKTVLEEAETLLNYGLSV